MIANRKFLIAMILIVATVCEGIVDYETFFKSLKEIGYQGYVGYEMCAELAGGGSIENLDRTARKFLEYIKSF